MAAPEDDQEPLSRHAHENRALQILARTFGGYDRETKTWDKRSVYIHERKPWIFDAFDERHSDHVHLHMFDFAAGLVAASPHHPAVIVEVQGAQHLHAERARKDAVKMAWANEHKDRVYFYPVNAYVLERRNNKDVPRRRGMADFENHIHRIIAHAVDRAVKQGAELPRPRPRRRTSPCPP
jgi:hypothetical protein